MAQEESEDAWLVLQIHRARLMLGSALGDLEPLLADCEGPFQLGDSTCSFGPLSRSGVPTNSRDRAGWSSARRWQARARWIIFPERGRDGDTFRAAFRGHVAGQMEGQISHPNKSTHLLYISGIEHIESQSDSRDGELKLYFQPGTDIRSPMAQVDAMDLATPPSLPPGPCAGQSCVRRRFDPGGSSVRQR